VKYADGGAFRMALEERLRAEALASGMPLSRLRKTVAFDRLLARLLADAPDVWVLKGGLALQARLGDRARTTKDIDLHTRETGERATRLLVSSALIDLGDFFSFAVGSPSLTSGHGLRCSVEARLDGRSFERFHVDLGTDEQRVGAVSPESVTSLLEFAGIPAVEFPCFPLAQHLAEKVHALARSRGAQENSRVKDLVDVVLLAETSEVDAAGLHSALEMTFGDAEAKGPPSELPPAPARWGSPYRAMAKGLALRATTLEEGSMVAAGLVNPVLEGLRHGSWSPTEQRWTDDRRHPKS
jgi:hypothetical protein